MEQQGATRGTERQVAEFVKDDEIGVHEPVGHLAGLSLSLFLFERVDQFDGGEEANALFVVLDRLEAKGCGEMGLPGSGPPAKDTVVGGIDEVAAMELADPRKAIPRREMPRSGIRFR